MDFPTLPALLLGLNSKHTGKGYHPQKKTNALMQTPSRKDQGFKHMGKLIHFQNQKGNPRETQITGELRELEQTKM